MTRRTSIDAYNEIKSRGLLPHLQMMVYEVLYDHGPLTVGEVWGAVPLPLAKPQTKDELIAELRKEITQLKSQLQKGQLPLL